MITIFLRFIKRDLYPWIFAIITVILWGVHGPAGRYLVLHGVSPFFVFSTRLWIGTSVFCLYLVYKKQFCLSKTPNLPLLQRILESWGLFWGEEFRKIIVIALIGLVFNTIVFHLALLYLPGTYVMIMENLAPIFVFIASLVIYGIKPKKFELLALFISFIGIFCIILGKDRSIGIEQDFYLGVLFCLLAAISFAGYILLSVDLMKEYKNDPLKIICFLFKIFLISAIVCTPFLLFTKAKPLTPLQWFWIIEMGIFQSGIAYIFWNFAMAHLRANTMSLLFMLTILTTSINEILFMGLKINFYLVLGGLAICSSGYWIALSK